MIKMAFIYVIVLLSTKIITTWIEKLFLIEQRPTAYFYYAFKKKDTIWFKANKAFNAVEIY